VFASLGLSGVGFAAVGAFSKYTDIFMAVTVVLLVIAHWLARKNKRRLNRIILWVSTVLVVFIIAYGKRAFLLSLWKG
jgi:uncharacterized membrane protein YozB (DUF420 family)